VYSEAQEKNLRVNKLTPSLTQTIPEYAEVGL